LKRDAVDGKMFVNKNFTKIWSKNYNFVERKTSSKAIQSKQDVLLYLFLKSLSEMYIIVNIHNGEYRHYCVFFYLQI
jgi:hypothetical protein